MPQTIIIAGPNGAGKTSFANKHFEWYVWDSLENEFRLAEAWND